MSSESDSNKVNGSVENERGELRVLRAGGFLGDHGMFRIEKHLGKAEEHAGWSPQQAGVRKVLTIKEVQYAFRWCPAGKFMMGSPEGELGRYYDDNGDSDETPHKVTLSHGFWTLETQVTQEMWKSMMGSNPSEFKGKKRPVEMVSWNDCQEFIKN